MNSTSNILIIFSITFVVLLIAVLLFYFGYRAYLNLRIQNKCKRKFFIHPFTFMLFMIIILLFVVIGVSHFNLRESKIEQEKYKELYNESKRPVFAFLKEDEHIYDIYTDGLVNNSLLEYEIKKETQNDFEYYFAKANQDIKYMANYIVYIRYIGTKGSLNGYLKYSINEKNSFQGSGNVEKEYIVLAEDLESLPKSIEIGLSDSMDKTEEIDYTIIKFDILN